MNKPVQTLEDSTRIILIDDDPMFGQIMKLYAVKRGISLDAYQSLEDLGFVGLVSRYDVAILDYDLGNMTGLEIGEYLRAFFHEKPMLLVSSTMRDPVVSPLESGLTLPFLLKSTNYDLILSMALTLHAREQEQRLTARQASEPKPEVMNALEAGSQ